MKICVVQIQSVAGDVQANIQKHLQFIERATSLNVDLIVFPELSITGYEPNLAKELATTAEDSIFDPFQAISNKHQLAIGIGMPTVSDNGINISLLIFQADKDRTTYSKQLLHADEIPYFVPGNHQTFLQLDGIKITFGICFESLQREHILNAHQNNSNLYIASVAKSQTGMDKANEHFPKMAREFKIPVLLSNAVGESDDFISDGQSAAWDKSGKLLRQLDSKIQGLLVYDTDEQTTEIHTIEE